MANKRIIELQERTSIDMGDWLIVDSSTSTRKLSLATLFNYMTYSSMIFVTELPTTDISTTTVYLVPHSGSTTDWDEYIYRENEWVLIGTSTIDLSAIYQTKTDNNLQTTSKQIVGAINEVNSNLGDITDATLLHTFTNADIKNARISNLTGSIYLKNNQLIINFKFYGNTDSTNGFVALTNTISVGSLPSSINGIIKPAGVREIIDHDNERHVGVACAAQFGSNYMYLIGSPIQLKNGDIYQDQIIIDLV